MEDPNNKGASYKPPPPRKRVNHVLSKKRKCEIINYLLHHRIEEPDVRLGIKQKQRCLKGLSWDGFHRPPTAEEASKHFKVPQRTINGIWYNRATIMGLDSDRRRDTSTLKGKKLSSLELVLFGLLIEWKQIRRKIARFRFQQGAKLLYWTTVSIDPDLPGK